jgi:hypothetical protein
VKIIFIVGSSRSGTTMLGRIFGNNSKVYTFGELHFFENLVDIETIINRHALKLTKQIELLERLLTTSREGLFSTVISGKYHKDIESILKQSEGNDAVSLYKAFLLYETERNGKKIPCEQTPRYLFYAKEILDLFPEAKIINMVRDPRDVLLSQKNKWRRRFLGARNIPPTEAIRAWANYHPYIIARLWRGAIRMAMQLEGHPRFISIRFEDLLRHPEEVIKHLCDFVGIEFEKNMLHVPQVGSSLKEDRPNKFGVDSERACAWQKGGLTSIEVVICQKVALEEMEGFGYLPVQMNAPKIKYYITMGKFLLKGMISFFLNLKRTKNLRETIRRRLAR